MGTLIVGRMQKAERPQEGPETTAEMIARVRLEQRRQGGFETIDEIVARCQAARQKVAAAPAKPALVKPAALPAAPQLRRMSAAELARGIEAVEADIETQVWARARRRVAGETG
jgi:hypothetical protein